MSFTTNAFPVHAFPSVLQGAIVSIQQCTQGPVEVVGMSCLAGSALIAQGHYDVAFLSIRQPISLYILTVAPSGERKTLIESLSMKAIKEFQMQERLDYEMARQEPPFEDTPKPPKRLIFQDPTVPGLLKAAESQAVMGIFTDEGGGFFGGFSMQKENQAHSLAAFSQLWDGSAVGMTRSGYTGAANELYNRRLSMHLQIQPIFLRGILGNDLFMQQGFLGRFLVTFPQSKIGSRPLYEMDIHEDPAYKLYIETQRRLLEKGFNINKLGGVDPVVLRPDEDAYQAWKDFYNEVEAELDPLSGLYSAISPTGAKAASQALRTAAVFEVMSNPNPQTISIKNMEGAIELQKYFLKSFLFLNQHQSMSEAEQLADLALEWIRKNNFTYVYSSLNANRRPSVLRDAKTFKNAMVTLSSTKRAVFKGSMEVDGTLRKEVYEIISTQKLIDDLNT